MSVDLYPPVGSLPSSNSIPSGIICEWGGATAPSGWLLCDGTTYPSYLYPSLATAIGNTWGGTPGSTFTVPPYNGRVGIGKSPSRTFGAIGGTADAVVPTHTHTIRGNSGTTNWASADHAHGSWISDGAGAHTHVMNINDRAAPQSGGLYVQAYAAGYRATDAAGGHNHTINNPGASGGVHGNGNHYHDLYNDAAGSALTDLNMPPYIVVNKIIKV